MQEWRMASDEFGERPGEQRIPLPESFDAGLYFIGRIRTPWKERAACPKNSHAARALGEAAHCVIEIDGRYAAGLGDVAAGDRLWALYWMDRAVRNLIVQRPRHAEGPRGVFSLRSPVRPNPVAIAAVTLIARDGPRLTVLGLDCLDNTPLIDLKPWFAATDAFADA